MPTKKIYVDGFGSFEEFSDEIGQKGSDHDRVWIFPGGGGLIILHSNGTWDYDCAPFSD